MVVPPEVVVVVPPEVVVVPDPRCVVPPLVVTLNPGGAENGSRPVKTGAGGSGSSVVGVVEGDTVTSGRFAVVGGSSSPPPERRLIASTPTRSTPATMPPIRRVRLSRSERGIYSSSSPEALSVCGPGRSGLASLV